MATWSLPDLVAMMNLAWEEGRRTWTWPRDPSGWRLGLCRTWSLRSTQDARWTGHYTGQWRVHEDQLLREEVVSLMAGFFENHKVCQKEI